MKKNARYTGGSGTGVDLAVRLEDGQIRPRHLDPGEALPADIGGVRVAEDYIDRLLEQAPEFKPAADAPATPDSDDKAEPKTARQKGGTA